jgi:hypothetical protein
MTLHEEEWWQRATFGKQVELFWGSQIGIYLQNRARECYTAGIAELKSVNPADASAVMAAQNKVWQAEQFERWLSEAVLDGAKALELLEGESDD